MSTSNSQENEIVLRVKEVVKIFLDNPYYNLSDVARKLKISIETVIRDLGDSERINVAFGSVLGGAYIKQIANKKQIVPQISYAQEQLIQEKLRLIVSEYLKSPYTIIGEVVDSTGICHERVLSYLNDKERIRAVYKENADAVLAAIADKVNTCSNKRAAEEIAYIDQTKAVVDAYLNGYFSKQALSEMFGVHINAIYRCLSDERRIRLAYKEEADSILEQIERRKARGSK